MCMCVYVCLGGFQGDGWLFVELFNQNETHGMDYFTFLDLDWFITELFPSLPSIQPGNLSCKLV